MIIIICGLSYAECRMMFVSPLDVLKKILLVLQDAKRNHMLLSRAPGPYEDKWGPIILGSLFVAALLTQALVKMLEKK